MNKKVEIDRDQLDIMHAVADGAKAMASSPTVEPDQSDDENIKDILKDLEKEEMRSPQFLNGVLISNNTYYRLLKVLEHANEDIKRGKRWEAIAMTGNICKRVPKNVFVVGKPGPNPTSTALYKWRVPLNTTGMVPSETAPVTVAFSKK